MRWPVVLLAAAACGEVSAIPIDTPPGDELGTLRQGCAVLLRMDEPAWGGAGSVRDSCGSNHGTPSGDLATIPDGARNRAGSFSGTGCIEIPDAAALHATTALTMSAWVMPTGLDNSNAFGVISKRLDMQSQSAYNLYLWTGFHAWVDIESNNDRFETTTELANGQWAQLTVVYDGARAAPERVRVYTNGVLDRTAPETAPAITPYGSPLKIGCLPSATTPQNFVGRIDEVGIWSRVLSEPEIAQWYADTRPR